jgi:hypothetical protein
VTCRYDLGSRKAWRVAALRHLPAQTGGPLLGLGDFEYAAGHDAGWVPDWFGTLRCGRSRDGTKSVQQGKKSAKARNARITQGSVKLALRSKGMLPPNGASEVTYNEPGTVNGKPPPPASTLGIRHCERFRLNSPDALPMNPSPVSRVPAFSLHKITAKLRMSVWARKTRTHRL